MNRHGQICQSCDNFTVEQAPESYFYFDGTLINSCPKTSQIESRESQTGTWERCGGFVAKQSHDDEVEIE